jgi:hypothetical protein
MGSREDYKKKLEVFSAIKDSQIKKPHHIPGNKGSGEYFPIPFYIQIPTNHVTFEILLFFPLTINNLQFTINN